jgi:hypothetical protein
VARARGRERGGKVAIHAVAQADEDAGREARFGFGHGPFEAISRGSPEALQRAHDRVLRGHDLEGIRAQRASGPDAGKVRAVVVGRRWPDAPLQLDAVARHDGGIPGQRRGNERRLAVEADRRRPLPSPRRAHALHDADPRPIAGWNRTGSGRRARNSGAEAGQQHANRERVDPSRDDSPATESRRDPQPEQPDGQQRHDDRRRQPDRNRPRSRSDGQPRRPRHLSRPSIVS